jgi:hypothetical protein
MTHLSGDLKQTVCCLRAGLYWDVLNLPDGAEEEIRRQIRRRIARLQMDFGADQEVLDDLKLLQDWLPHRLREYEEWVQPCLDYVFAYLGGSRARAVVGAAVEEAGFTFRNFQKRFIEPIRTAQDAADLPPTAASDSCSDISISMIRTAQLGTNQCDYMYADGEGCGGSAEMKQVRDFALDLVDSRSWSSSRERKTLFSPAPPAWAKQD